MDIIFLTGAPNIHSLSWAETELLSDFLPAFDHDRVEEKKKRTTSSGEHRAAAWRLVPLQRQHLSTGLTPDTTTAWREAARRLDPGMVDASALFLTSSNLSFTSIELHNNSSFLSAQTASSNTSEEELLSQFYEHSFALHQDLPSSPIGPESNEANNESELSTIHPDSDLSSAEVTLTSLTPSISPLRLLSKIPTGQISDLIHIPSAGYLQSIVPQTMSVNLIVGVIHIGPTRVVRTRQAGREMEIVEILVGDETKAGFGISLWFSPESSPRAARPSDTNLRASLSRLRPQDIILARNVALSSFRGRVYGQSLRGNFTHLHLLSRGPAHSPAADDPHGLKVQRVRDWVLTFVGAATRQGSVHRTEVLPPDTP